jgi:hypothetical protein
MDLLDLLRTESADRQTAEVFLSAVFFLTGMQDHGDPAPAEKGGTQLLVKTTGILLLLSKY